MTRNHISDKVQGLKPKLAACVCLLFAASGLCGGVRLAPLQAQTSSPDSSPGSRAQSISKPTSPTATTNVPAPTASETPANLTTDEDESAENKIDCRLPIALTFTAPDGLFVRSNGAANLEMFESSRLLSINGQVLRDKSREDILNMISGREGESATLEILSNEGELKNVTAKYVKSRSEDHGNLKTSDLGSLLSQFDGTNGPQWDSTRVDGSDVNNIDLFTAARCRNRLIHAKDDPATSSALIDATAIESAGYMLTEGNLIEAKRNLEMIKATSIVDQDEPRVFSDRYGYLLEMLNICGLSAETISIGTPVIEADLSGRFFARNGNYQFTEERLPAYRAYLRVLAKTNPSEVPSALQKIGNNSQTADLLRGDAQRWLGDLYETMGLFDKAIACYETYLVEREKMYEIEGQKNRPDKRISEARYHCNLLYRLGQFALKQKNLDKAISYLQRAEQVYSTSFSDEAQTHLESIWKFSPSPSTIDHALAIAFIQAGDRLSGAKYELAATSRLQKVLGKTNDLFENTGRIDDESLAKTERHLTTVEPKSQDEPSREEQQFMSTVMVANAAITSGDTVLLQSSLDALCQLFEEQEAIPDYPRPCVNKFCCLTYLARQIADHKDFATANSLLMRLKAAPNKTKGRAVTNLFCDIETALNSDMAGKSDPVAWMRVLDAWKSKDRDYENLRALACLYIDAGEYARAEILMKHSQKLCGTSKSPIISAAFCRILLDLDRSYLYANTSKFDLARRHFDVAVKAVDSLQISSTSRELDSFNRMFMTRAVQLAQLYRLINNTPESEKIFRATLARLENKACWLGVFEPSDRRAIDDSLAYLFANYGRLLFDRGSFAEARTYLDKAADAKKNNVPYLISIVRAKCALQQGDYATAAQDFVAAARDDLQQFGAVSVQPGLKNKYDLLALKYALKATNLTGKELADLYKRAAEKLDDETFFHDKLEFASRAFASMHDNTAEKNQMAQAIATLNRNRNATVVHFNQIDPELVIRESEGSAILAEKSKSGDTPRLWMDLAGLEIDQKHYERALEHVKRSIETEDLSPYNGEDDSPGIVLHYWPIATLARAGKLPDPDGIYAMRLNKTKILFGITSRAYSFALAEACNFYVGENNRSKAMHYLDQLLAFDPRKQDLNRLTYRSPFESNAREMVAAVVSALPVVDQKNLLIEDVLNKILDAQIKTYGHDDPRVSKMLVSLANCQAKTGAFDLAEHNLRDAVAISTLFGDVGRFGAGFTAQVALEKLLRTEHRDEEAQKLAEQREEAAKKSESNRMSRVPSNYQLLKKAQEAKDWNQVLILAPKCIESFSHGSMFLVQGCDIGPQAGTQKMFCFKSVIEACVITNKMDQAHFWLSRAVAEQSYKPQAEELIFLSEIELACGNKVESREYCKKAEDMINKNPAIGYYQSTVEILYRKIGKEADIKRLDAANRAQTLKRQDDELRKFETDRKLKRKLHLKQPPTIANLNSGSVSKNGSTPGDLIDEIQPNESMVFPAVHEVKGRYLFNYVAFATEGLGLAQNALVLRDHSVHVSSARRRPYSFAGSFSSICCFQPLHQAGDFMFLYDGARDSLIPKFELDSGVTPGTSVSYSVSSQIPFTAPPDIMASPLQPALKSSPAAAFLSTGINQLKLKPGDYVADKISASNISIVSPGRVRLFLNDKQAARKSVYLEREPFVLLLKDERDPNPIFELKANSVANGTSLVAERQNGKLEIWYDGRGTIEMDKFSRFTGLIYAPNATIRIGDKSHFLGAMVAKYIFVGKESELVYQTDLTNWSAASTTPIQGKNKLHAGAPVKAHRR